MRAALGAIALVPVVMCSRIAASAEAPAKGSDKAPMGSPEFYPSPERPYGWRGDWTGRFPGATPPTQWSRRAKGVTLGMKQQAKKPSGEPGADAKLVEYFTLRDWLVAGPFNVEDPVKDIDKDFLGGETAAVPDEGTKAAEGVAWKSLRTSPDNLSLVLHNEGTARHLFVDFVHLFGKRREEKGLPGGGSSASEGNLNTGGAWDVDYEGDFHNKVAYAHTYVYALNAGPANLHVSFDGKECRTWLNGTPVKLEGKGERGVPVDLIKGWNRLLLKVSCAEGKKKAWNHWVSGWQCAAYFSPRAPVQYESHNIAWMTPLTGRSASQPIVVGDRIFLGSNHTDLMCLDKTTGKVLWLYTHTAWDSLNAEDRAKYKETVGPLLDKLNAANLDLVAAINDLTGPAGKNDEQAASPNGKLKVRYALERELEREFQKLDSKRFMGLAENEYSSGNATPVSDGKYVYWVCGGCYPKLGATLIAAHDLSGKLVWAHYGSFGLVEHGNHSSPSLAHGKLVYGASETLVALEAATGKEAWRQKAPRNLCHGTSLIATIGGEPVVAIKPNSCLMLYKLADGTPLTSDKQRNEGPAAPVIEDGIMYQINRPRFSGTHGYSGMHGLAAAAFKLPSDTSSINIVPKPFVEVEQAAGGASSFIATPLLVGNSLYAIDTSGYLAAYDMKAGKELFHCFPDWHNCHSRLLYGTCASPALGGDYIYLVNGAGETLILKPGPKYEVVARNVIEDINRNEAVNNPCGQDMFLTAPVFEGKTMYLRGRQHLYCIGGK